MRVLFLTEGTTVPASRFRVGQFLPYFRERGVEVHVRAGYGDLYNKIAPTALGAPYKIMTRLYRIASSLDVRSFDIVFFQRPALPFTALPEVFIHRLNGRTIFDVDDAIFLNPDGTENPKLDATFERIVDTVEQVICGNSFLANRAARPEKTKVIPTVIDTDRYEPAERDYDDYNDEGKTVIGWMGTAGNFPSLRLIMPALRRFLDSHESAVFRIVSNAPFPDLQGHRGFEEIPWSAETEIDLLRSFDVGIMPLVDTLSSCGKCGFKMIQYMAVGTPVIASPVGANVEIFEGSNAGVLAGNSEEWEEALIDLVASKTRRRECGQSARRHAVEKYSIRSVIDDYMEIFERVAYSSSP